MSQVAFRRRDADGAFVLEGSLSIDTVPGLWSQGNGALEAAGDLTVDLDALERVDSAGLALLIEWTRRARENGQRIRFANPPDQMLAIARVSGLDTMLPFQRAETERE